MISQQHLPHLRLRALISFFVAFTLSLAVTAAPVAAVGLADQNQEQPPTDGFVARSVTFVAQTFTAGLSGTLNQVDLRLGRLDPLERNLTVQIQTVLGGTPTGVVLASAELTPADVPVQNFPDLTFVRWCCLLPKASRGPRMRSWSPIRPPLPSAARNICGGQQVATRIRAGRRC